MTAIELKIANWLKQNIFVIVGIMITGLSVIIRMLLFPMVSYDAQYFLLPWYNDIETMGGFSALSQQVGNYNVTYQFIIALCTYIPLKPLVAYKIVSCVFDYIMAVCVGYFVYLLVEDNKKQKGFWAYIVVCLSPIVFLNSSCWGQCDSIYVMFCILSLLFMYKDKHTMMLIFWGCALAFKLQAIFLLPVIFLYYFVQRRFSLIKFVIVPIVFLLLCIPAFVCGRTVKDVLWIYKGQVNGSVCLTYNYPNVWCFITESFTENYYEELKMIGIFIAICILAILIVVIVQTNTKIESIGIVHLAFVFCAVCILFLPAMHERYGYLIEILSIILAFCISRTWIFALLLHGVTLVMYSNYLFDYAVNDMRLYAGINIAVILGYIILYFEKTVFEGKRNQEKNIYG